jgi:chromosome segregation ATPase
MMLVDMLPFSLSVPSEERHEVQKAAADMVEQTLNAKKSVMQSAVAAEDVKLAELMASQTEFTSTVSEAETAVASQKEVVHTAKSALAEATTTANASRTTLTDLRTEQKEADAKLQDAREEKAALESALENHFKPMMEDAAGQHFKELEPFLKKLEMEESLLIALPSTCAKSKEHRGTFDNVVMETLEKAICSKISTLGDTVTAETPASVQRQLAVEAAEKDFDAKKEIQKQAVAEFEVAQKEHTAREATLSKAKQTLLELKPQVDLVTGSIEKAKLMLEAFETGPLAGFKGFSAPLEAAPAGA